MKASIFFVSILLLPILALALPSVGFAQQRSDDELARSHFMAGESYFQQGRYDEAAEQFMEAFNLSHRSVLLINAATSYERGLRFDDAIALLERHQREFPDSEQSHTVANKIESLRTLRDRQAGSPAPADHANADTPGSASPSGGGSSPGPLLYAGLGLGGLALISAAVAIGTGVVSDATYQDLRTACPAGACSGEDYLRVSEGALLADVSTAFTFIGAISAVAAVVLIAVDLAGVGRSQERSSLELGIGLASVSLTGRFQ